MDTLFTAIAFLVSGLIFLVTRKSKSKKLNLPPGPPGWPVVGNLFHVARSGKPLFQYVRELHLKYGPIFTLRMGTRTMIIVADANLVHEALIEKAAVFATRPVENPTRAMFSCNKFTVNAALYGPVWRSLRRNMVQNMLSTTRVREFKNARENAMDKLVKRVKAEAEANDGAVWVLKNARFAVFCILLSMCFGLEMEEKLIEEIDQIHKDVFVVLNPTIDDYLPILGHFFSKQRKRVLEIRKKHIDLMVPLIQKRRNAIQSKTAVNFSYLDTLFDLKIEGRKSTPSYLELVTLVGEFLNGGTDTTATAVEWAIARLIENHEIQSKMYEEIRSVCGSCRKVDEKDLERMPYLNAVVKELLRKHPPSYFSLSHAVTEPATLGGYDVPTDTNVDFFLPAISDDPKLWSDPMKFDPDRFLSGGEDADITGGRGVKMIPFGVGRRICPGLAMATLHVNLLLARMIQEFEWSAYPNPNCKVDFTEKMEFTVVMKHTLRARVKPRLGL